MDCQNALYTVLLVGAFAGWCAGLATHLWLTRKL